MGVIKEYLVWKGKKNERFWAVQISGSSCSVVYGREGSEGGTYRKTFVSKEKCQDEVRKLIAVKRGKGYVPKEDNTDFESNEKNSNSPLNRTKKLISKYDWQETLKKYNSEGYYFDGSVTRPFRKLSPAILSKSLHYVVRLRNHTMASIPLGASKLKGLPHLPKSIDWPDKHYFLAQYNLTELSKYDLDECLPKKGMLYLFYDAKESCKIFYYSGPVDKLQEREYPTIDFPNGRYYLKKFRNNTNAIKFVPGFIFYAGDDNHNYSRVSSLIDKNLRAEIENILSCELMTSDASRRMFGRPIYKHDEDRFLEKQVDENAPNKNILLFQDQFDDGVIHIWIDRAALTKLNFSHPIVSYSGN